MSDGAGAESLTDWLVDKIHPEDSSTLVWRKDGKTVVYIDFEEPGMYLITVTPAEVVSAPNQERKP